MLRLIDELWIVSGHDITYPWDASAYLVKGDEPTLIDCGSKGGYPALKHSLQDFGYQPGDIRRVIGTHGHWDHLSGMAQLQSESSAELWMHEADSEQVRTGDPELTAAFLYGEEFPPARVDRFLRDGDQLAINDFDFTVYHTPGHTPGSICLWTRVGPVGLLISGDTLWGGYSPRVRSNIDDWSRSLDRLLELDFDLVTIGHYSSLIADAKRKTREARVHFGQYFDPWFKLEAL